VPPWILPTIAGICGFAVALLILSELADGLGLATTHNESYFDADGEYHEGGLTRVGFVLSIMTMIVGGWAAAAVNTRRLDGGLPLSKWGAVAFGLGAVTAHAVVMDVLVVTFEQETRHIPDVLFNLLDTAVLAGCGYGAYRLYNREKA